VARIRDWNLIEERSGFASFGLAIRPGDDKLGDDVHADLMLKVHFSNTNLNMTVDVVNGGDAPLPFRFAFHTYFAVSNVSNVQVSGLDTANYSDNLLQRKVFPPAQVREITQEIDRVYYDVAGPVAVSDNGHNASLIIAALNLPDVVLWNPWIEKAKKMADLPDDGYNFYVCVEHGAIKEPVVVPAKGTWSGSQLVQVNAGSSKI
jgi:glucose-6-phosphate 1-epimerase